MSPLDAVLRSLLSSALNANTFCIVKSTTDQALLDEALLVDQTAAGPPRTLTSQLLSSARARCVAVVDRSADVEAAARAIAAARFGFGGASPYAPDLVLVNEFVKTDFFEACSRYATLSFAGRGGAGAGDRGLAGRGEEEVRRAVESAEGKGEVSSFGSNDFKLVDITDK